MRPANPVDNTYANAFLKQAQSDHKAYEVLSASTLPMCHRLHYLQMWLEKLCKAYLWRTKDDQLADELGNKHYVIAVILPKLIRKHWRQLGFEGKPNREAIEALCRQVDRLHPQIKDGGRREDNVEYPWRDRGDCVQIPSEWDYPLARELTKAPGKALLKATVGLTQKADIFAEWA